MIKVEEEMEVGIKFPSINQTEKVLNEFECVEIKQEKVEDLKIEYVDNKLEDVKIENEYDEPADESCEEDVDPLEYPIQINQIMSVSVVQTIKELKIDSNYSLSFEKRLEIKTNGRPLPELQIRQTSKDKKKEVHRNFRRCMYDLSDWICGCEVTNAFYCFVCLIFSKTDDSPWCKNGITDLKHLKEKMKKHSLLADHMKSSMNYATMGRVDIRSQLDSTYRKSIIEFNEKVTKNRYILNKIIDCVKFCGAFELALLDETQSSENPGVFRGLVDFVSEFDSIFKEYFEMSTFFNGTSKTVQNELLESMLSVAQEEIKSEVQLADFIALQVDETTDNSNAMQMIFVIRYVLNGSIHERFLKCVNPPGTTTEILSNVILKELEVLEINKKPEKLISQSYDGASTMSGNLGGVQTKIKEQYPAANFIHGYAHQLHLILQKAVSQDKNMKIFFANLDGFSTIFTPKRTALLEEFAKARLASAAPTKWNFNTRCVETVLLYQIDILACIEEIIETEEDSDSINQALVLKEFLQSDDFLYWLNFFYLIMPNCEILSNKLLRRGMDDVSIKKYIAAFKTSIASVKNKITNEALLETPATASSAKRKKPLDEDCKRHISMTVCDTIISEINQRFSFSDHLIIAQLFYSSQFEKYKKNFPDNTLKLVKKHFPFINNLKLQIELNVIYEMDDFRESAGTIAILQLFINNNLCDTFSESVKLLNILCTLPMTTMESERCFSTLKRIKTFLHNTMEQETLSALAMLSVERSFIKNIVNFNELVIDHFANRKDRQEELKFKRV